MDFLKHFWGVTLLLFVSSLAAEDHASLETHLRGYEGRWVGEFTIHSVVTGYTETFEVEQQYWWKNDKLHGVAVMEGRKGLKSTRSISSIQGNSFISEIKTNEGTEQFIGVLRDGKIIWLPRNKARLTDHQITEQIILKDGKLLLITDGFDTFEYKGKPAEVVYKGRLIFVE